MEIEMGRIRKKKKKRRKKKKNIYYKLEKTTKY